MIDLSMTKTVLTEAADLVEVLHGKELDETNALNDQSKGDARRQRAKVSQELQLLISRFELAAQLARLEYWHARGHGDPTRPDRTD